MNYETYQGDNMARKLCIKYSVLDAESGKILIKDAFVTEDHSVLNADVEYFDTDRPVAVREHFFNIKVSTLEY